MDWPRRNVLSRFPGFTPAQPACELLNAPTGIAVLQTGIVGAQPTVNADPAVNEAFERPTNVVLPVIGDYIPTYTPTAAIGVLVVGISAIGYRTSYHGTITTAEDGADVEAPFGG